MKRWVPLVLSLVLLVAVVWALHTDAPNITEAKEFSIKPGHDAGLKIYIDPVTKQPVEGPVEPSLEIPSLVDELNLSDEGLILEDGPISGEMVNLQGRFRHRYTAGIDPDGRHTAGCDLPKSTENNDADSEEE